MDVNRHQQRTPYEICRYLESARVEARLGRRCIDRRYRPKSGYSGRLARPGGDFGFVPALIATSHQLGLDWSPEFCSRAIYSAVTDLTGSFDMHTATDDNVTTRGLRGCRHLELSTIRADQYGLLQHDVHRAYDEIDQNPDFYPLVRNAILTSAPLESGVIINQNLHHSFDGQDEYGYACYVYDRARDWAFTQAVAEYTPLGQTGRDLFIQHVTHQSSITLHLLSLSLPAYVVEGKRVSRLPLVPISDQPDHHVGTNAGAIFNQSGSRSRLVASHTELGSMLSTYIYS